MKYTITNDKGVPATLADYSLKYSKSYIRDCGIDEILK